MIGSSHQSSDLTLRHPLLAKLNALAVCAAWACLALFCVALAYGKITKPPDGGILPLVVLLSATVVLAVAHVALSFFVRCPHCNRPLTAQGLVTPKYGNWSGAVIKWFKGSVVCMHCGGRVGT
jgi:hypothetical protein